MAGDMFRKICIPKGTKTESCKYLQNTNSLADFVLQAKRKENKSTLLWSIPSSSLLHNHAIIRAYLIANPPFLASELSTYSQHKGSPPERKDAGRKSRNHIAE